MGPTRCSGASRRGQKCTAAKQIQQFARTGAPRVHDLAPVTKRNDLDVVALSRECPQVRAAACSHLCVACGTPECKREVLGLVLQERRDASAIARPQRSASVNRSLSVDRSGSGIPEALGRSPSVSAQRSSDGGEEEKAPASSRLPQRPPSRGSPAQEVWMTRGSP